MVTINPTNAEGFSRIGTISISTIGFVVTIVGDRKSTFYLGRCDTGEWTGGYFEYSEGASTITALGISLMDIPIGSEINAYIGNLPPPWAGEQTYGAVDVFNNNLTVDVVEPLMVRRNGSKLYYFREDHVSQFCFVIGETYDFWAVPDIIVGEYADIEIQNGYEGIDSIQKLARGHISFRVINNAPYIPINYI